MCQVPGGGRSSRDRWGGWPLILWGSHQPFPEPHCLCAQLSGLFLGHGCPTGAAQGLREPLAQVPSRGTGTLPAELGLHRHRRCRSYALVRASTLCLRVASSTEHTPKINTIAVQPVGTPLLLHVTSQQMAPLPLHMPSPQLQHSVHHVATGLGKHLVDAVMQEVHISLAGSSHALPKRMHQCAQA